jgi:GTP-dependent phosphoenolpyruvate carboxykinase
LDNINEYKNKNMIPQLHEINGKLDMIQDLKIQGLGLSLDQQEKLLNIHQQLIDRRVELIKEIKKQYII